MSCWSANPISAPTASGGSSSGLAPANAALADRIAALLAPLGIVRGREPADAGADLGAWVRRRRRRDRPQPGRHPLFRLSPHARRHARQGRSRPSSARMSPPGRRCSRPSPTRPRPIAGMAPRRRRAEAEPPERLDLSAAQSKAPARRGAIGEPQVVTHRRFAPLLLGSAAVLPAARAAAQEAATPAPIRAAAVAAGERGSVALSIEELAQLPVRSASKREEPLSGAPTAFSSITGDDIVDSRRDFAARGAAPGPQSAGPAGQRPRICDHRARLQQRRDVEQTARPDRRAKHLFDAPFGRVLGARTPLLEDIEQIEVISGPGGTLYGPNAVNGVISIASRDARETIGGLVRGTAGTFEQIGRRALRRRARRRPARCASTAIGSIATRTGAAGRSARPGSTMLSAAGRPVSAPISASSAIAFHAAGRPVRQSTSNSLPGDGNRGHNILAPLDAHA